MKVLGILFLAKRSQLSISRLRKKARTIPSTIVIIQPDIELSELTNEKNRPSKKLTIDPDIDAKYFVMFSTKFGEILSRI